MAAMVGPVVAATAFSGSAAKVLCPPAEGGATPNRTRCKVIIVTTVISLTWQITVVTTITITITTTITIGSAAVKWSWSTVHCAPSAVTPAATTTGVRSTRRGGHCLGARQLSRQLTPGCSHSASGQRSNIGWDNDITHIRVVSCARGRLALCDAGAIIDDCAPLSTLSLPSLTHASATCAGIRSQVHIHGATAMGAAIAITITIAIATSTVRSGTTTGCFPNLRSGTVDTTAAADRRRIDSTCVQELLRGW